MNQGNNKPASTNTDADLKNWVSRELRPLGGVWFDHVTDSEVPSAIGHYFGVFGLAVLLWLVCKPGSFGLLDAVFAFAAASVAFIPLRYFPHEFSKHVRS